MNLSKLFFYCLLDSFTYSIIFPFIPILINSFSSFNDSSGITMAIYFFMQFISSPIWGILSDIVGRKKIILISLMGTAISLILCFLSSDIFSFIIARVFCGIFAGASLPTIYAYVSDTTTEDKRVEKFGLLGSAWGLGFIIGPFIGGVLCKISLQAPFFFASIIAIVNFCYSLYILPSSNKDDFPFEIKNLKKIFSNFKLNLSLYLIILFITTFALSGLEVIFPVFSNQKFNFSEFQIGLFFTLIGIVIAITQGTIVGRIVSIMGEYKTVIVAHICMILGYIILGNLSSIFFLIVSVIVLSFGIALNEPVLVSLISKSCQGSYGYKLGMIWSYSYLARSIGPIVEVELYRTSKEKIFIINFILIFVAVLIITNYQSSEKITHKMRI